MGLTRQAVAGYSFPRCNAIFKSNNLLCWIIWHLLAWHFCLIFSVWLMFWSKKACSCGATEAEPQTGLSDLMTDHLTFSQFYQQICTQVKISGQDIIWLKKKIGQKKVGAVCHLPAFANQRLAWAGRVGTGGSTQLNSPWSDHNFWQENMSTQGIPHISLIIFQTFPWFPITWPRSLARWICWTQLAMAFYGNSTSGERKVCHSIVLIWILKVGHTSSSHWKAKAVAARANYLWKSFPWMEPEPVRKGSEV